MKVEDLYFTDFCPICKDKTNIDKIVVKPGAPEEILIGCYSHYFHSKIGENFSTRIFSPDHKLGIIHLQTHLYYYSGKSIDSTEFILNNNNFPIIFEKSTDVLDLFSRLRNLLVLQ